MVEVLHGCDGFLASENRLYISEDRGPVYDSDKKFRFDAVSSAYGTDT